MLHLSNETEIVVTLGTSAPDGRFVGSADDVAVFFSRADAQRHGVPMPEHR